MEKRRHGFHARRSGVEALQPVEQHPGGVARQHCRAVADPGQLRPDIFELRQIVENGDRKVIRHAKA